MNNFKFLIIIMIFVSLTGCWSSEVKKPETNNINSSNNGETSVDSNLEVSENPDFAEIKERLESAEKGETPKIEEKRKPNAEMSPTEVLKEFDAATNSKDFERIKQSITKGSIEFFENEAKKKGMTFKQLVEQPSEMPTIETPEMRNEKIDGNKATVEAKNRILGTFDKYPLVKENGVWKVAYNVYLTQKLKELNKGSSR